jgi:hypothetical protein
VRTTWFHVPGVLHGPRCVLSPFNLILFWLISIDTWADPTMTKDVQKARSLIEKKSTVNLVEAFRYSPFTPLRIPKSNACLDSVAVKHYLRGEEGIYYEDLYHLVKHLPPYALPAGIPSSPAPSTSAVNQQHHVVINVPPSAGAGAVPPSPVFPSPLPNPRSQQPQLSPRTPSSIRAGANRGHPSLARERPILRPARDPLSRCI